MTKERIDDLKHDSQVLEEQGQRHGRVLERHEYQLSEHGKVIDAQGQMLARHADALAVLPPQILTLRDHITGKVSIERYVWVERLVIGGAGAGLLWLLQHVLDK